MNFTPARLFDSLSLKFSATAIGLVVAVTAILSLYAADELRRNFEDSHSQGQYATARKLALELDARVRDRVRSLEALAAELDRGRLGDAAYLERYLASQLLARQFFPAGVLLVDLAGNVVADAPAIAGRRTRNVADRPYMVQAIRTGKPFVGGPIMGRGVERPVLNMSAPVLGEDGAARAVLVGVSDLRGGSFLDVTGDSWRVGSTEIYLVSTRDELVIAAADASRVLSRLPEAGGAAKRIREGGEGSARLSSPAGVQKFYSFARVPTPDWTLVLATPEDDALRPLDRLRARVYGTGALLGGVALLVGWLVTRRLTGGLKSAASLLDAMSADENVTRRLPEAGDAEIRALFASFNRLSSVVDRQRDALRASEARLQLLIDHAPAALAMFDTQMRYLALSRRWRSDYDLGDREIVGRSHYEIFPEIPQRWKDVHRRALAGEILRADADAFARLDGGTQWISWEVRPWRTLDGAIGGIVIFSEDVTARRQAELDRQTLASAIEQSQESVIITDPAMRITYVNAAFSRISGYAPDDVIGRSAAILGGETTPKATLAGLAAAMAKGEPWTGEFLNRRRDGHIGVDLARIAPVRDADGRITHYVSVQEDVTERRRLEGELDMHRQHLQALVDERTNQLRAANDRLSATQFAMDSVGIGIQWVDPVDGRIVYTNRVGAALAGRTVETLTGLTVSDVDPNFPPVEYARLVAQLRERRRMQFESENVAPDGRRMPVEVMLHYLDADAGAGAGGDRIVAFLTDIGERKAAQAVLVQAKAAAESANLAKSRFLANMSHEIRTPLNGVLGMAGLLRRTPMSQKQAGYLDRIEASGRHLLAVINDILDLSKIEAGRLELDAQDFALDDLMSDVESTVDARVAAKGLRLSFDVRGVPQWLHGDRTRLAQALVNYLGNAVKFTQSGGIEVRCRALERAADTCLLRFEVHDTGVGLAREALARVFEAFEQGDMSTTREFGGTGLGLTITRRLAQAMGGDAGADSEPGRGSTFWFTARLGLAGVVPVGPGVVVTDAEQALRREFAGTRVLLVEDDPVSRELARVLLESAGLVVEAVENGLEAVGAIETRDFALVLMDVQMPVMDGLQATVAIRQLARGAAVPVLALTANAFAEDREACLKAGMNDVVIKPLEPDVLFASLLAWLRPRA